jgi:hypothetical protein
MDARPCPDAHACLTALSDLIAAPRLLLCAYPSAEHPPTLLHATAGVATIFRLHERFPRENQCVPLMKKWNSACPICNCCAYTPAPMPHRLHVVHVGMQLRTTCLLMGMQVATSHAPLRLSRTWGLLRQWGLPLHASASYTC